MVEIIKTLQEQIQDEIQEWQKLGIADPAESGMINPNVFLESVKVRAALELLLELGVFSQEQIEGAYQKAMLDTLKEARAGVMELRKQALGVPKMVIPKTNLH